MALCASLAASRMVYKLRSLIQIAIKGETEKLLNVHLHVKRCDLDWLNANAAQIIPDLCGVITENIVDIEKTASDESAHSGIDFFADSLHILPNTENFRIFYAIDKKVSNHIILEYDKNSNADADFKRILPVAKFSVLVWLMPINDHPSVPIELLT